MSYFDRIRQAGGAPEAMAIIAQGIDEILERLAAGTSSKEGPNEWGSWGGGGGSTLAGAAPAASSPQPDFYAAKKAEPNVAEVTAAEARVLRWEELYAKSPTPANLALLEQAHKALDQAMEPGEYLDNSGIVQGTGSNTQAVEDPNGQFIVELPPVSAERKAARRQLAEAIDLPGFFPPIWRTTPESIEQIIHGYEVGGPRWLYANRITPDQQDIFNQLPPAAKVVMVTDIALDDQREAWEFQRDIMKTEDVEGGTLGIAMDNIDGIGNGAQVPLRGQE